MEHVRIVRFNFSKKLTESSSEIKRIVNAKQNWSTQAKVNGSISQMIDILQQNLIQ